MIARTYLRNKSDTIRICSEYWTNRGVKSPVLYIQKGTEAIKVASFKDGDAMLLFWETLSEMLGEVKYDRE